MIWRLSNRADPPAVALADQHYSRQKPGTPQFVATGSCIVLLTECRRALWVSHLSPYDNHAWSGAWKCSLFRNEGAGLSSELIRSAIAATRAIWGEPPAAGVLTFVDPARVRHKRDPGRCFLRAGFRVVGRTKRRKLLALQMQAMDVPAAAAPLAWQPPLFAESA